MPFPWQRHTPTTNPTADIAARLVELTEQMPVLTTHLETIQGQLAQLPQLDPRHIDQMLTAIEAQIAQIPTTSSDVIAERLLQLAYRLFRGEVQVTVQEHSLIANGDFLYLPIDPSEQYELIFYHPTDPTMLGVRIVLNRHYATVDPLTNTLALHIRVHRAPPGLVDALIALHDQSGPVFLGYREGTQEAGSHEVSYWPYSGTSHNQHPRLQGGIYADHLIFYYLLRGGTAHTYADEADSEPVTQSEVTVLHAPSLDAGVEG